jgi:hypothetical protein
LRANRQDRNHGGAGSVRIDLHWVVDLSNAFAHAAETDARTGTKNEFLLNGQVNTATLIDYF